mmetsp:Transcript_18222/g.64071  ORF Transcript_18222/g.64071 Transcript_18222/m.64071 type:complete len:553 (-) Transcript_18222:54-1712(-)
MDSVFRLPGEVGAVQDLCEDGAGDSPKPQEGDASCWVAITPSSAPVSAGQKFMSISWTSGIIDVAALEWLPRQDFTSTFLPIATPAILPSLAWTVVVSLWSASSLLLYSSDLVGNPVLRGLIYAWPHAPGIAGVFLVNAPLVVCGRFRHRYHLVWILMFAFGVGAAHLRVGDGGQYLGVHAVGLGSFAAAFITGVAVVNPTAFASQAHKHLDHNFAPPIVVVVIIFTLSLYAHGYLLPVTHGSWVGSLLGGLLIPTLAMSSRVTAMKLIRRCYLRWYFDPKLRYKRWLREKGAAVEHAQDLELAPPILHGDLDMAFGVLISMLSLIIESMKFVTGLAEVVQDASSLCWAATFAFSFLFEALLRTGLCAKKAAQLGDKNFICQVLRRLFELDALEVALLQSHFGVGYIGVAVTTACSMARAIRLGDSTAFLFADVSRRLPLLIGAELLYECCLDLIVYVAGTYGISPSVFAAKLAKKTNTGNDSGEAEDDRDRPLADVSQRAFGVAGHCAVFVQGGQVFFVLIAVVLGPRFLSGLGRSYNPMLPGLWLASDVC